jgi:hypothetical protein
LNKPKFGADPGRRAGLRKAIDETLEYLADETGQYTRKEFARYDDRELASCLLACMLMDIGALDDDKCVKIATKALMNAEVTPEALRAAALALDKATKAKRRAA